jgi:hypothetical protein
MAATYSIRITMSPGTVNQLTVQGSTLYGFKAVCTDSPVGAVPLVWFTLENFSQMVTIEWQDEECIVYTTKEERLLPGATLTADTHYPIVLGQQLVVSNDSGSGTMTNGSNPGAVEIINTSGTLLTCGIGQIVEVNGQSENDMQCAFPVQGKMVTIAPIEQVILMMATTNLDTGGIVEQSSGQSVLLDFTSTTDSVANITYDFNSGWSAFNTHMTTITQGTYLVPILINESPKPAEALKVAQVA